MKKSFFGHSNEGGIYKIINLKNGKVYIGSTQNFKQRAYDHNKHLKNNTHYNKHLQASFNKYGEDVFVFEVIEVKNEEIKVLRILEQKYLSQEIEKDNWENCYNFYKKTSKESGAWSKNPELTKIKLSIAMKQSWSPGGSLYKSYRSGKFQEKREETNRERYGVKNFSQTEERRKKVSLQHKGKKLSIETKQKISLSKKGKKNSSRTKFQKGHIPWNKGKKIG